MDGYRKYFQDKQARVRKTASLFFLEVAKQIKFLFFSRNSERRSNIIFFFVKSRTESPKRATPHGQGSKDVAHTQALFQVNVPVV